ncbi:MAG: sulfite exporter TauE/SafE family protein [Candidatus Thiodiazotropha sp. (ex Lucinoma borealis)]|nr:sulfite exporter TauE/SafE family protein [Candidatus Thiodiazotropha sp. (ex Lucinoma borealis)]
MLTEMLFLFTAGFFGGILNSIAGGGSFITFPALIFAGIPPIIANATNTFASCSGYLSGAYAFRKDLLTHKGRLPHFILIGIVGGITGALLLIQTSDSQFREVIPWLLLFATLIFMFGRQLNIKMGQLAILHKKSSSSWSILSLLILLLISIYGGFFNAGMGIIILGYLALFGHNDINTMNGIKLIISTSISLAAITLFIVNDAIAWYQGTIVLIGTLLGGYVAAHYSRMLPQTHIRGFVIIASITITSYFFYEIYL